MPFSLGATSRANLVGVHPKLVAVVERAIQITDQDFSVHDGCRTIEEQREYFRRGVSKTMRSRHLTSPDGFGHAVDLVPFVAGKLRWEWPPIYHVAAAMRDAAAEAGVALTWGGTWDRPISSIDGNWRAFEHAVASYCGRHPGPDFIDGPHYELLAGV